MRIFVTKRGEVDLYAIDIFADAARTVIVGIGDFVIGLIILYKPYVDNAAFGVVYGRKKIDTETSLIGRRQVAGELQGNIVACQHANAFTAAVIAETSDPACRPGVLGKILGCCVSAEIIGENRIGIQYGKY